MMAGRLTETAILCVLFIACAHGFTASGPSLLRGTPASSLRSLSKCGARNSHLSVRMSGTSGTWEQAKDEAGNVYYYNTVTGESSWDLPQAAPPAVNKKNKAFVLEAKYDPNDPNPKVYPGGKEGLMAALNPIKKGYTGNPLKEPSLILFFGFKAFVIGWALFVGFHNKYAGDFGPFITFHDGQVDFGQAAVEWARLHGSALQRMPK